ncbi:hypothetical protein R5R35_012453 [Gryllus longicercus]|uniref:Symplekin/Pta1 N-terminal domain-containing protein n=1 Tax=Gryllus longicercus TaxID=2509291 RepID=A0AAN9Z5X7_9ORTH
MSQDIDARRSTAAQFFMEDDSEEQKSSYNKIVDWLNHAAVATDKVDTLRKVQEIIINKEESLLDNFLEEVLGFQNDRNQDVRKFIVGFIEEACKKDPDVLPRVVTNLAMLLKDQSIQVQKRVVQAACAVYRSALSWLAHARAVTDEMETTWNIVCAIKGQIFGLVDSDNDGLRTQAIKLLESVVLMQTYPEPDSLRRDNDFSLEDVPLTLKIARRRKLEEEAHMVFELMLKFHGSMHISSVNLMTCMGSIALIAKMRPQFMGKVVTALETLNANLPPTLSKSQVSSVRKHLKLQLLNLLRLPSSVPFHNNITTMLSDLGASNQEVMRCLPRMEELRRHKKRLAAAAKADANAAAAAAIVSSAGGPPSAKRPRLDAAATAAAAVGDDDEYDEDDDDDTPNNMGSVGMSVSGGVGSTGVSASGANAEEGSRPLRPATEQAVDITEQFIVERLSPEMAAQLVMVSMSKLPDTMPPHFSSMYTPIAAAGTQSQIRHVARLMATQLTALGLGPGFSRQLVKSAVKGSLMEEEDEDGPAPGSKASIVSAISGIIEKDKEAVKAGSLMPGMTSTKLTKQRIKTLKLSEITKPLEPEARGEMLAATVRRILRSEKPALLGGVAAVRNKIITTIAATYDDLVRREVLYFLLEDVRGRLELALAWLYEEYAFLQGFNRMPTFLRPDPDGPEKSYNDLLCALARHLIDKADARDRDALLTRLYLEAPLITEDATDLLRTMCLDESRAAAGLALLRELVTRRPPRQLVFLNALLVHTAHENTEIRSRAISCVVALYDRGDLRCIIEEYAILYLGFLRLPAPPDVLFGPERGRPSREHAIAAAAAVSAGHGAIGPDGLPVGSSGWTEEMVRACLYLYLAQKLIHE